MSNLTARQQQVLRFIQDFLRENGIPPTRIEIAEEFGFRSPNASEDHLKALASKGAIELMPGASRGIRIVKRRAVGLPLVGRVAAGSPILAEEHIEGHYQVDGRLFRARPDYLLRVRGMSMRDAGILDGDLLAVRRTTEVSNGEIVVARLEDEVTVKRFRRRGQVVRLLPENPDYEPIVVNLRRDSLTIEGVAVGVIRDQGI